MNTWNIARECHPPSDPMHPSSGAMGILEADRPPHQLRIWPIPPHPANSSLLELTPLITAGGPEAKCILSLLTILSQRHLLEKATPSSLES